MPSALPTASPEPPNVAIPRLEAKLKANPNDQQAMSELAAEFLQINRPDLAVQLTHHLLQIGDKTAQVYYFDGVAMEELGQDAAGTYDLEQASNLDPTNMGVLSQLAETYLKQNRPADAERVAKRAATFNKTEPQALMTSVACMRPNKSSTTPAPRSEQAYALNTKDASPIYLDRDDVRLSKTIFRWPCKRSPRVMIDPKSVSGVGLQGRLIRQTTRRRAGLGGIRRRRGGGAEATSKRR